MALLPASPARRQVAGACAYGLLLSMLLAAPARAGGPREPRPPVPAGVVIPVAGFPQKAAAGGASVVPAEQKLKARHQALFAAYNRRDLKTLRTFYAPNYEFVESPARKIPLREWLTGLGEMFKILPRPGKDSATLTRIKIAGDTATTVEKRLVQTPTGEISQPSFTAQTWKRIGGVWKLAREQEAKE